MTVTMMTTRNIEYSEEKLIELVLYIGAKCGLDEHYGTLKLNKILFYSDFRAFRTRGKPITGATYKKYTHGPAPSVMKQLRRRLESQGTTFEYKNPLEGINESGDPISEKRLLPMRKPRIDEVLHPEEIAIVDLVIEQLRPLTGKQVSRKSHTHRGWKVAHMEKPIPYVAALLPDEDGPLPLSAADFQKARQIARDYSSAT